jgi:hypothetical protein
LLDPPQRPTQPSQCKNLLSSFVAQYVAHADAGYKPAPPRQRPLATIFISRFWVTPEGKWDAKFPMIAKSWRSNWARVIPFFAHPPEIRKVIYTTNAIESLNMSLRKVTKARGSFPNDEAVSKLLYLAQHCEEVDHAAPRLEGRAQSLRHHLRKPTAGELSAELIDA